VRSGEFHGFSTGQRREDATPTRMKHPTANAEHEYGGQPFRDHAFFLSLMSGSNSTLLHSCRATAWL
jgi:hypothetical protein